jgi:hypothetical protein
MITRHSSSYVRLSATVLAIAGAWLPATYFARWWPYTHREEWQVTVLSTDGQSYVASAFIPLPLVPCLLLGVAAALWIASMVRGTEERRE